MVGVRKKKEWAASVCRAWKSVVRISTFLLARQETLEGFEQQSEVKCHMSGCSVEKRL